MKADALESALATLTERDAMVLSARFGLDGGQEQTLEAIGAALGLTRERIRQIEAAAMSRLAEDLGANTNEG
jgi:RNA polymerase primary sigma factor